MTRSILEKSFSNLFPHLNRDTTVGMLVFQGFLAGIELSDRNHRLAAKKLTAKDDEISLLKNHISNLNQYFLSNQIDISKESLNVLNS